jgi:hypothetical protein
VFFTSCSIEMAKPEKKQRLVIASDFLHEEDTLIFRQFVQKHKIRVVIRHLSPEDLIKKLNNSRFNSGIDLVLAQNSYTALRLNNLGMLHDFEIIPGASPNSNPYISYKHNFVGIGLDPFVFNYPVDSIRTATRYRDLRTQPSYHLLSNWDLLSFFSPLRRETNQGKTYSWIKDWKAHSARRPENGPWSDSVRVNLCKYSQLTTFEDSTWQSYSAEIAFPESRGMGTHYELIVLAIVDQAEHFDAAQKFIEFCENPGHNEMLNKKINRFPIYDFLEVRQSGPRFYPVPIDRLVQFDEMILRMLRKLPD